MHAADAWVNAKEVEMLTAHGVKVSLAVFLECLTFFLKAARGEWVVA